MWIFSGHVSILCLLPAVAVLAREPLRPVDKLSVELRELVEDGGSVTGRPVTLRAMMLRGAAGREVVWLRVGEEGVAEAALRLAEQPEVMRVERYELMVPDNDATSWLIQSGSEEDGRTVWRRGLTGVGQVIGVADTGLDVDACQFRYSGSADAITWAVDEPQPPEAVRDRPGNKVITYYVLGEAEAYDGSSAHYHGTHSTGNAAGDDFAHLASGVSDGHDPHDGMAPGAQIVFQDIGSHDGYLVGLVGVSMYDVLAQAHATGVRIHSNSYGVAGASPEYDIDSASIDEAVWAHNDLVVLFSAGNYGPGSETVNGTGAVAKNTLTVGASGPVQLDVFGSILELSEDLLFFSSQGPTADGRLKPDVVAPGMTFSATTDPDTVVPLGCCDRAGDEMFAVSVSDDNCSVDHDWPAIGTSFSTPVTAGAAALVRQYFVDGFWRSGVPEPETGFNPTAALVKAVLINGAVPLGGGTFFSDEELAPRPAPGQGWGRVNLEEFFWFDGDERHALVLEDVPNPVPDDPMQRSEPAPWPYAGDALTTGDERTWLLPKVAAGGTLKVTLVWNDPPGVPGADPVLVNDLDLEVWSPEGERWLGNRGFAEDGLAEPAGDEQPDRLNNVEGVFLRSPGAGAFRVRVIAHAVPGNDLPGSRAQGFSIVASAEFLPPLPEKVEPARAAPGEELSDVTVTGRDFVGDVQLDFGPGVELSGCEVIDERTIHIALLTVSADAERGRRAVTASVFHSLTGTGQDLFRVGAEGCGCGAGSAPGGAFCIAIFGLAGLHLLRRTRITRPGRHKMP